MYLTPYQKKQLTTVIILVVGIPLTIFGMYKAVQWFTSSGTDTQPRNVVVANVTTNSITVTWTTESKQTGSVVPVLNGSEQGSVVDKRGNSRKYTHYVELKSLEPGTKYDFKIISGGDTYTNSDNNEFSFTTANISTETPVPKPVHGELGENYGDDVLIYLFPKDKSTYPVATVPSSNGNWLIDLSSLRRVSDKGLYTLSETSSFILIAASGVDNAGTVEGIYGDIFNSSGKLTESLVATGGEYDTHISNEAKLVATGQQEEEDPTPRNQDNGSYTPPQTEEPEEPEDEFDREYELRTDLAWVNLISADGSTTNKPANYGLDTVMITNLTDVSFTVLWYSENKETGHIMYGTTQNELSERGRDERDGISTQGEYYLHSIEVTQLQPESQYYFEVYSGEEKYEEVYELATFETQSSPPQFETIAGTTNAQDYESVVVIATFVDDDGIGSSNSSLPISTLVDSQGSWVLTIGGARDDNGEYFDKSSSDIVKFDPKYFTEPHTITMTVGEATLNEVELSVAESTTTTFTKIPKLSDYGILID